MTAKPNPAAVSQTVMLSPGTKAGHTFDKWTASSATGNVPISGNSFVMPASDVEVTAIWTANSYNIMLNLNGGSGSPANPATAKFNDTVTLDPGTKEGHDFDKWTVTSTTGSVPVSGNIFEMPASDVTATANWTVKTHTVTFSMDGGSPQETSQSVRWGEKASEPAKEPTKASLGFIGWYLDDKLTKPFDFDTPIDGDLTLYAGWAVVWRQVAAGNQHTLAIATDGSLWAWGENRYGQLGNDKRGTNSSVPVRVGTFNNWVEVAARNNASFGIRQTGTQRTLWAWGMNASGVLGLGDEADRAAPVQVTAATNWVTVAAGYEHMLGIRGTGGKGQLWAWGYNRSSQLGDGTTISKSSPVQIGTAADWVAVAGWVMRSLGIRETGGQRTLWAWGYNNVGQLGNGTATDGLVPAKVAYSGPDNWIMATAGYEPGYGIRGSGGQGTLWAWGSNRSGQFGNGTTTNSDVPVPVIRR